MRATSVEHLLSNYDFYYVLPKDNNFGGVGIYVHNDLDSVQIMDDLSMQETCRWSKCNVESLFINSYTAGRVTYWEQYTATLTEAYNIF